MCRAGPRLAHQEEVDGQRRSDGVMRDQLAILNSNIMADRDFSGCLERWFRQKLRVRYSDTKIHLVLGESIATPRGVR